MTGNQMTLNYGNFILLVNVLVLLSPLLSITLRLNGHLELDKHSLNIASNKGGNANNEYIPVDTLEENADEVGVTIIEDEDEKLNEILDALDPLVNSGDNIGIKDDASDGTDGTIGDTYYEELENQFDQQELELDGSSGTGVVIDNNQNDNLETVGDDHQRFPSASPVGNKEDVVMNEGGGVVYINGRPFSSAGYEFLMDLINRLCPSSSTSPAAAAVSTNVNGLVKPPIIIAVNKEMDAREINNNQLWNKLKEISPQLTGYESGLRGLLLFSYKRFPKEYMDKYGPSLKIWLKKSQETNDIIENFSFNEDCQKALSEEVLNERSRRNILSMKMYKEIKSQVVELKESAIPTLKRFLGDLKASSKVKNSKQNALYICDWLVYSLKQESSASEATTSTTTATSTIKSRKRKASRNPLKTAN